MITVKYVVKNFYNRIILSETIKILYINHIYINDDKLKLMNFFISIKLLLRKKRGAIFTIYFHRIII